MKLRLATCIALASLAGAAAATSTGCSAEEAARGGPTCAPQPSVDTAIAVRAVLPDLSALGPVDCATGSLDAVKARQIYDAFFGPRMPKTTADFQFAPQPSILSQALVERVQFPAVYGATVATYHALFGFDPAGFTRAASAGTPNFDLFTTFGSNPQEPYQRVNVLDYVPATLTHYARLEAGTTDIMATQFVFRMACMKTKMEAALASCPDCVDAFTPLSREDLGRVLELRFARVNAGVLEVSKPFKVIGVDSSGSIATHATTDPYLFAKVGGTTLRARWRGELSGKMATVLGRYGGPTPALMRAAIGPSPGAPSPDAGAEGGGEAGSGGGADGGVAPAESAPPSSAGGGNGADGAGASDCP